MDRLRCDLLCEDREQEALFRKILESRSARVRVLPRKARGGFTFVHQQLKTAVTYIRQRSGEAVGLLVVIDGDQLGVAGRWDEIRRLAGLTGAAWEAKVAVCIPRRNVETWELWLCGRRDLEESSDYKRDWQRAVERGEVSVRQAIDAWFRRLEPNDEEGERSRPQTQGGAPCAESDGSWCGSFSWERRWRVRRGSRQRAGSRGARRFRRPYPSRACGGAPCRVV